MIKITSESVANWLSKVDFAAVTDVRGIPDVTIKKYVGW